MSECIRCNKPVSGEGTNLCASCSGDSVIIDTSPLPAKPPVLSAVPAGRIPRIIRFRASGEQQEYRLDRTEIAIGTAPHNQIVLDDPTVSASHAIISHSGEGYGILDLASRNGTLVNGERLNNRSRVLQHGDRIQLGETILTYRLTERFEAVEPVPGAIGTLQPTVKSDPPRPSAPETNRTIKVTLPRDVRELVASDPRYTRSQRSPDSQRSPSWLAAALVNSTSRIISTLIGACLTVWLALYLARYLGPSDLTLNTAPAIRSMDIITEGVWVDFDTGILGARVEASGAASRPGLGGMLLVTDRGPSNLVWMSVDSNGSQTGPLTTLPMRLQSGEEFIDPEAITYGNSSFYLLTSLSDPIDLRQHHLVRFDLDPVTREFRGPLESIGNIRELLLRSIPELTTTGSPPGSLGGLNAEGLAWDPGKEQLLIGLRSPLIGNQAVLIPLLFNDPRQGFKSENVRFAEPRLILLPLDGQGVRDMTFDPQLRNFLILSGPPENRPDDNFNLWEWNGRHDGHPRRLLTLDGEQRPEGLTSVSIDGQNYLFITGDGGGYVRLKYSNEQ